MIPLQTIREACIKANPEIRDFEYGIEHCEKHKIGYKLGQLKCEDCIARCRPIRLADVLFAMNPNILVDGLGVFWEFIDGREYRCKQHTTKWNLKDDNLEQQSEETLTFISELLK